MAFFSKAGNILRQTVAKQVNSEICGSKPSMFQMMRCMSSSKVFVGGLSYNTDDTGLNEAFNKYGQVIEARVIMDRESGRSRGFGFVTYASSEEASAAIQALDGQELHGRNVRVNYANDRPPRPFGGGGGGSYGGNFGGGGYGGNYGGGGGGGYGDNSGYGGGSNYSSGGGGGGYGGNNFASRGGADNFGAGNQSFGVSGGEGGNDGGFASEFGGGSGSVPFGNKDSGDRISPEGSFGQNNEGGFGDDADEPTGYANKA